MENLYPELKTQMKNLMIFIVVFNSFFSSYSQGKKNSYQKKKLEAINYFLPTIERDGNNEIFNYP
jgi:hypothetical protein